MTFPTGSRGACNLAVFSVGTGRTLAIRGFTVLPVFELSLVPRGCDETFHVAEA